LGVKFWLIAVTGDSYRKWLLIINTIFFKFQAFIYKNRVCTSEKLLMLYIRGQFQKFGGPKVQKVPRQVRKCRFYTVLKPQIGLGHLSGLGLEGLARVFRILGSKLPHTPPRACVMIYNIIICWDCWLYISRSVNPTKCHQTFTRPNIEPTKCCRPKCR